MKVFQELSIEGPNSEIAAFLDDFPDPATGWKRDDQKSRQLPGYVAISVPQRQELPEATVYLYFPEDSVACILANIIPSSGDLNPETYNRVLQAFHTECVRDRAKRHELQVNISPAEIKLEDSISPPSMSLLRQFSDSANKANAASHPRDRERWLTFLAASLSDGEIIDRGLLEDWLLQNGWPEEIATELGNEYVFASELMPYVQPDRDSVSALR